MKYFILVFIVFITITSCFAQRKIEWVHGLGSDASFWYKQSQSFPGRVHSRKSFNDSNVSAFANDLKSRSTANSRKIMIGHSMGGVAIRELEKRQSNNFGGAITFGAPLDGAKIVNNLKSGTADTHFQKVEEILRKGEKAVDDAPALLKAEKFIHRHFNVPAKIALLTIGIEPLLKMLGYGGSITSSLNLKALTPNNSDLAVGSSYMTSIKGFTSSKPKVVVYGDEDSPAHVRIASSAISSGKNDNSYLGEYNALKTSFDAVADSWEPGRFCITYCKKKESIADAWKEGYNYLNSGMEADWNKLIDSYGPPEVVGYRTVRENICDDFDYGPQRRVMREAPIYDESCWVETRQPIYARPLIANDGLLNKNTQTGKDSQWTKSNTDIVRAPGVNHMEMGEHEESRAILRGALDGERGYDAFFRGNI
ncbi:Lecithin:cholesterol acyltransferase [Reichenbachiella agariperforans]|uniref:Lecithin:cholesterol acyltransferase n=1 Tax=Reichenbachiella agariperforans TaxID=156994 RepID=A0A1M6JZU2_REIAG|nr:alpha/beta hydrolase [Reichenbachiella agariperforans]SHJ52187.1 Lecithin:cholesterol acyltransferase [Reichenbachiella agariperforans]